MRCETNLTSISTKRLKAKLVCSLNFFVVKDNNILTQQAS